MATIQFSSDFRASHCPQKYILTFHTWSPKYGTNFGSDFWFIKYGCHIHDTIKKYKLKIFSTVQLIFLCTKVK